MSDMVAIQTFVRDYLASRVSLRLVKFVEENDQTLEGPVRLRVSSRIVARALAAEVTRRRRLPLLDTPCVRLSGNSYCLRAPTFFWFGTRLILAVSG